MFGRPVPNRDASDAGHEDYSSYIYPSHDLLEEPQQGFSAQLAHHVQRKRAILERTLQEFNVDAHVVEAETGPAITMFELKLAPGLKVARITSLSNDLARSLEAGAVRIVAPIPGKHTIGIEVPNSEKEKVRIKELLRLSAPRAGKMHIPLFLGKDGSGNPLVSDLTGMPHLLIAGTTGSGKSVCLNSIIMSILLTQRPDMVKMILVDPKMVEMNAYRDLPHLMCPIVTEMKRAEQILEWLTTKMDERYALLSEARVRNIADYNKLTEEEIYERFSPSNDAERAKIPLRLPYLVLVIDELADLMMTSAKEVEAHIIRIAQKSRAVGIHLVVATQRPQATVVTGLIKSNLPSRISFRVSARMDSRIVLDQNGAEMLLGQGDMLFLKPGTSDLTRAQGTFLSDDEIHGVVTHIKTIAKPTYNPELMQMNQIDADCTERDELFDQAVEVVLETKRGSVSLLQRRLTIGYSRASRLVEQMAAAGIVGEYKGAQAREVLISKSEFEAIKQQMQRDAAAGFSDLAEDDVPADTTASLPIPPHKTEPIPGAGVHQLADNTPALPLDNDDDTEPASESEQVVEDIELEADDDDDGEYEYEYVEVDDDQEEPDQDELETVDDIDSDESEDEDEEYEYEYVDADDEDQEEEEEDTDEAEDIEDDDDVEEEEEEADDDASEGQVHYYYIDDDEAK